MCNEMVSIKNRSKTYETPPENNVNGGTTNKPSTSTFDSLQIENIFFDSVLCPPKGTIQKKKINQSSHATKKYNIVEDLAKAPCAMSTLEVLQNFPRRRRNLLSAIGFVDP